MKRRMIVVLLTTLCLSLSALAEEQEAEYKKAEKVLQSGDYAQAYDMWSALGGYQDSASRAAEIVGPAFYAKGLKAAQEGDYREAFGFFSGLGDYEDSARKAEIFGTALYAEKTKPLGEKLFGFRLGGKWGIGNWEKNTVTSAIWDDVSEAGPGGLMIVRQNGLFGCADSAGRTAVPCAYAAIPGFTGEDVIAQDQAGKWTLFSLAGAELCGTRWEKMTVFGEEDPIAVRDGRGWGFIDRNGFVLAEPAYSEISSAGFRDGMCAVKRGDGWGFVNREGRETAAPVY